VDADDDLCIADDTIVELLRHALPPAETRRVAHHVAACRACRRLVSAAVFAGLITPRFGDD
jgi:hypothetical protein